jgi:hypothetical protein
VRYGLTPLVRLLEKRPTRKTLTRSPFFAPPDRLETPSGLSAFVRVRRLRATDSILNMRA